MNKTSIILLIFLAVAVVVIIGGIIYYNGQIKSLDNQINEQKMRLQNYGSQVLEQNQTIGEMTATVDEYEKLKQEQEFKSKYNEYANDKIGIYFAYPKEWGELAAVEKSDGHEEGTAANILVGVKQDDKTWGFFYAAAMPPKDGRGGWWGDEALKITGQEYIDKFCEGKENCTVFTNKNGVAVAKLTNASASTEGWSGSGYDIYYIYNPKSEFHGITFYTVTLEEEKLFDDAKSGLAEVIDNFKFLE